MGLGRLSPAPEPGAHLRWMVGRLGQLTSDLRYTSRQPKGTAQGTRLPDTAAKKHEQWYLAQAVCALTSPATQRALDNVRRDIMVGFATQTDAKKGRYDAVMLPCRQAPHDGDWSDWLLTPELHADLALSGLTVSRALTTRLRNAHKAHVRVVVDALARA